MSTGLVVTGVLVVWLVVAVVLALLLGAVAAQRDRQRPVPRRPRSRAQDRGCRSVPTRARRRPHDRQGG